MTRPVGIRPLPLVARFTVRNTLGRCKYDNYIFRIALYSVRRVGDMAHYCFSLCCTSRCSRYSARVAYEGSPP